MKLSRDRPRKSDIPLITVWLILVLVANEGWLNILLYEQDMQNRKISHGHSEGLKYF